MRRSDVGAIRRIARQAVPFEMTVGTIMGVTPNFALVQIDGSARFQRATYLRGGELFTGDQVIMVRPLSRRHQPWVIMGAYSKGWVSGSVASEEQDAGSTLVMPQNFAVTAMPHRILLEWDVDRTTGVVTFEVQRNTTNDADGNEVEEAQVRGGHYLYQPSDDTKYWFRVRGCDQFWNRTAWTEWAGAWMLELVTEAYSGEVVVDDGEAVWG